MVQDIKVSVTGYTESVSDITQNSVLHMILLSAAKPNWKKKKKKNKEKIPNKPRVTDCSSLISCVVRVSQKSNQQGGYLNH